MGGGCTIVAQPLPHLNFHRIPQGISVVRKLSAPSKIICASGKSGGKSQVEPNEGRVRTERGPFLLDGVIGYKASEGNLRTIND